MDYISELIDFNYLDIKPENYTYGYTEVKYPRGAFWYSFSEKYLKHHVVEVKEVFPNLSKFDEL